MTNTVSDKKLIDDYFKGDDEAFDLLVKRHLPSVFTFAFSYVGSQDVAEDVTQDAFIKAWHNLKKFDTGKNFKTWIFSITKNSALDFLKKRRDIPFSVFDNEDGENILAQTIPDGNPLLYDAFDKKTMLGALKEAIFTLKTSYQSVLNSHYFDKLTFAQIALSSGEPLNTVKSRHRRALGILREQLSSVQ